MTKVKTPTCKPGRLARGRPQEDRRMRFISDYVRTYLGYDIRGLISTYMELLQHVIKHEGELAAVKKAKAWYDVALRRAGQLTFEPIPFTKTDKEGFPKVLSFIKPLLTGETIDGQRAALTVMQLYKLHKPQGNYSLQSITAPATGIEDPEFMKVYDEVLEKMFPSDQLSDRISSLYPGFHVSGRNGPNGPMLGTAFVDREAIRNTEIEANVRLLCRHTQDYQLLGLLNQSRAACTVSHVRGKVPLHSRIRIKYESGGKARPFAIVDFFSQSALKPIHQFLMDWLQRQGSDGTSSHSKAAEAVKVWTRNKVPCWSYDLTTATDRWPVTLIHRMMVKALGQEIADAWRSVIVDRTFEGPNGEQVRWAVGQPLGALSSWASFAISHHAFIRTCERLDYLRNRKIALWRKLRYRRPEEYYRMIGDDITIAHLQGVAQLYRSYLDKFGLAISLPKSVLPEQATKPAAELAKRLFISGQEITPVPPEAILEYSNPYGIRALLETSLMRGYQLASSPYPVQSTRLSRDEWRLLTFPFRNALPQLNGVKQLFPVWNGEDPGPAGLNPAWFTWLDTPSEDLRSHIKDYILNEVRKAEVDSYQLIRGLSFTTGTMNPLEKNLPQGGDWKPGLARCHPQIVLTVLRDASQKLMELSYGFGDPNLREEDLYTSIGKFHIFLDPKLMVYGRNYQDQKNWTRRVMSKIVRYVYLRRNDKPKSFSDTDSGPTV